MSVATVSSLSALAQEIQSTTKTLEDFTKNHSSPILSFEADAPARWPTDTPQEILTARNKLLDAVKTLHDTVLGPAELLKWQTWSYTDLQALHWIYHFKIPQSVPTNGSGVSYDDLARATGTDTIHLRRFLRHAMLLRLFQERKPGMISHTAGSKLLATDKNINSWVGFAIEEMYPASYKVVEAHKQYPAGEERRHSAWNIHNEVSEGSIYDHWAKNDPEKTQRFALTIAESLRTEGWLERYLINGYNWGQLPPDSVVVDVGGSTGHASIALAQAYPNLKFIVQDVGHNAENGKKQLPSELKGRVDFTEHDFFTPQPVKSAAVYFLQYVLLDYSDEEAAKILQQLIPAMGPESKIIIRDGLLPGIGQWSLTEEQYIRRLDLLDMGMLNAGQRDIDEFKQLFKKADPRLTIKEVNRPEGSINSIIVLELAGGKS